jgi:fructose-1,6-bisphosphatase I
MAGSGWHDFDTLESFIAKEQRRYPESRGVFADLLRRVGVASKVISAKVQKAGLLDVLGKQGSKNVQDEEQAKLDVIANEIMKATFHWMPLVGGIATEEEENYVAYPPRAGNEGDRYIVCFDPLDGSSNIDANVSVGTIFSIHRVEGGARLCEEKDFFQPGNKQLAAGYVIYGSSTMFVFTTGHGVHGFTLDPEVGEYVLSHEGIRIPDKCTCFSANEANYPKWDDPTRRFVDHIRSRQDERYAKTSSRYIGSLVADFHRNLLYGGVFMYPADAKTGKGKLRLLYECAPMAMLAEQAGGLATTGKERVLDVVPTQLHQRVPFVVGTKRDVELYIKMVAEAGK